MLARLSALKLELESAVPSTASVTTIITIATTIDRPANDTPSEGPAKAGHPGAMTEAYDRTKQIHAAEADALRQKHLEERENAMIVQTQAVFRQFDLMRAARKKSSEEMRAWINEKLRTQHLDDEATGNNDLYPSVDCTFSGNEIHMPGRGSSENHIPPIGDHFLDGNVNMPAEAAPSNNNKGKGPANSPGDEANDQRLSLPVSDSSVSDLGDAVTPDGSEVDVPSDMPSAANGEPARHDDVATLTL